MDEQDKTHVASHVRAAAPRMSDEQLAKLRPRMRAKYLGDTFYASIKPCKLGHMELRYTSNAECFICSRMIRKGEWHLLNR